MSNDFFTTQKSAAIRPINASTDKRKRNKGTASPYLAAHRNGLIFRIRIPIDLHACLDRKEYRRSIGRCYAQEAKLRALRLAAAALEVFSFARTALQARASLVAKEVLENRHISKTNEPLCPKTFKLSDTLEGKVVNAQGLPNAHQTVYSVATERDGNMEKNYMSQENIDDLDVSTLPTEFSSISKTHEFQGRSLGSLTDDEIRSIADRWLLNSLKGNNRFLLEPQIQQAVVASRSMELDDGTIITNKKPLRPTPEDIAYHSEADATTHANIKEIYRRELRDRVISTGTAAQVDNLLAAQGISTDLNSERQSAVTAYPSQASTAYQRICHEFLKAKVGFYDTMGQTVLGNYTAYDNTVERLEEVQRKRVKNRHIEIEAAIATPYEITDCPTATATNSATRLKLSEAIKKFFEESEREGKWTDRTQTKSGYFFELFQTIIDSKNSLDVYNISASHIRRYKEILFCMPKVIKKEYKSTTLIELIEKAQAGQIPEADKLALKTIENHFVWITAFINWLATNDYHANPKLTGILTVKKDKQAHEHRDPYARDDIRKIFAPSDFLNSGLIKRQQGNKNKNPRFALPDSSGMPSRFWVPLLGLFTGARQEELCQLHLIDIVAVSQDGLHRSLFTPEEEQALDSTAILKEIENRQEVLCLLIRSGENQSIKNSASKRYVPISQLLTKELGFIGYLSHIHKNCTKDCPDNKRVFPELKKVRKGDTFSNAISNWYRRYREDIGIVAGNSGGRKDFHSFRHTLAHWGDQIGGVPEKLTARYLGHEHGTMTYGRYSTDTAPHILYEQITAPFTEYVRSFLDTEGLKQSKWAGL